MDLHELGLTDQLIRYCAEQDIELQSIGRVISEHKERYTVRAESGEYSSTVAGKLVYEADDRSSFPATGDWVEIKIHDDDIAIIHSVLPRSTLLSRQAAGKPSDMQIIAANINFGLIVQAVDRDFSLNRIERYLTICAEASIKPILILSKTDLITHEELSEIEAQVSKRANDIPFFSISNTKRSGYDTLEPLIEPGKTYCLLGSSGVGKSSLINNLAREDLMKTGEIGAKNNRGKHVTTHRELTVLASGGILIDNPGMRSLGIADASEGLETTFEEITELARKCRFNDCTHVKEKGCQILKPLKNGSLDKQAYDNFQRLKREATHYQSTVAERRQKGKNLAKHIQEAKRNKRPR